VTPASAKDAKRICAPAYAAYKQAVDELKAGHLHEAREQLKACMQSGCAGLKPKCSATNDKLLSVMPTVVPVVTDESGGPRADIQVKVDGEVMTTRLDGMGIPVEPGIREFTFATDAGVFSSQKIMVLEGQRNRPIAATLPDPAAKASAAPVAATDPKPAPSPPSPSPAKEEPAHDADTGEPAQSAASTPADAPSGAWAPPRTAWPYLLGGVGLAGVGAGALFTVWGNKDNAALQDGCSPNCHPGSIDRVRAMYIAADVSFGVGVVGLGVATWLFARSHSEDRPTPKAAVIDVHPVTSGAFASVSGVF
jgi:hypothetical protein